MKPHEVLFKVFVPVLRPCSLQQFFTFFTIFDALVFSNSDPKERGIWSDTPDRDVSIGIPPINRDFHYMSPQLKRSHWFSNVEAECPWGNLMYLDTLYQIRLKKHLY